MVKALRYKPTGRGFDSTVALGSTQPLTEMSTRCISWGVKAACAKADILPSCAVVMKSGNLNFLELSGPLQACKWTALHLTLSNYTASFSFEIIL